MLSSLILASALVAQTPPSTPAPEKPAAYVKFEPQVNAKPGEAFVVKVDTNLVYRRWTLPPGLTIVPPEHTKYGDKAILAFGPVGAYRFKLEGTYQDQWAEGETVIFVGQPSPNPAPPGPTPPPVPPDTTLHGELQRLYDADSGQNKANKKEKLCNLWIQAGEQVCGNPKFTGVRQFRETLAAIALDWPFDLTSSDLKSIREKIAPDLNAALGKDSDPIGPPNCPERVAAKAVFDKYAAALMAVK